MRSVADDLRDETRRQTAVLTPDGRVRLALELGDADVAALSSARQVSAEHARALIARSRRVGRHPSQAHGD
jgi:hypothetical protein